MTGSDPIRPVPGAPARTKPAYRVLVLDAAKNVLRTENLLAHTDTEALALAEAMAWQNDVELWDGLRFIDEIAARPGRPAQAAESPQELPLQAE